MGLILKALLKRTSYLAPPRELRSHTAKHSASSQNEIASPELLSCAPRV